MTKGRCRHGKALNSTSNDGIGHRNRKTTERDKEMDIQVMYKLLTRMPLLQGINGMELARIEERIGLQTEELAASRYHFITQGQPCREMVFLVGGTLARQMISADGLYIATELCYSPMVIEADKLYGLSCVYGSSYRPTVDCQLIRISKKQVGDHLLKSDIFRLNYMNMLSAIIQRQQARLQPTKPATPGEKICRFIAGCFAHDQGEKQLQIKMTDLAEYISETRLTVSSQLNQMASEGIIHLKRKEITIPDLTRLK